MAANLAALSLVFSLLALVTAAFRTQPQPGTQAYVSNDEPSPVFPFLKCIVQDPPGIYFDSFTTVRCQMDWFCDYNVEVKAIAAKNDPQGL
jgi:hypothetical protein